MTVALETSKRKFHALLDNLTTGPLTSHPPDSPASKRSRVGTPDSSDAHATTLRAVSGSSTAERTHTTRPGLAIARSNGLTSTSHRIRHARLRGQAQAKALGQRIASTSSTGTTASTSSSRRGTEPNYTPWSHTAFLTRLRTFADLRRWTSKPELVNEVAWAKRGWVCEDGQNTVACRGGCEAHVVVALRPPRHDEATGEEIVGSEDFSVDVADGVVERFQALIVDGHLDGCLWKLGGCKDDVYRLPMARPGIWQPRLRERYASFAADMGVPDESMLERPGQEEEGKLLEILGTDFFTGATATATTTTNDTDNSTEATTESHTAKLVNRAAFAFAMHGWRGVEEGSGLAMATCDACFRRVGLWLYTRTASDTDGEVDAAMKLDLIGNHRDYCPWVNAESQSMPGTFAGLAAWEILRRVVVNGAPRPQSEERPTSAQGGDGDDGVARDANDADRADRDRVRFARLKELTKAMSFKGLKKKR